MPHEKLNPVSDWATVVVDVDGGNDDGCTEVAEVANG